MDPVLSLTISTIEDLAPDQASLKAAGKLLKPAKWPLRQTDKDYIWGECQGSGANPYRVIFDLRDHGYKCTCPSRKFPCKHTLALALMFAETPGDYLDGQLPEWGADWLGRRRKPTTQTDSAKTDVPKQAKNLAAALATEPEPVHDPKKAAAQEAARKTRAEATKAAQMAGLSELETWISDMLSLGLPQVLATLAERCRTISARMSDAKAPALSGRLDDIPERVMTVPQAARSEALIEELGKLVLLSRAAQTQPQPLGVQRIIASAESRDTILADPSVSTHKATWHVIASHIRTRKDGMVAYSTWLLSAEDTPRFAQLLDFVPAALGKRGAGFTVGDVFEAEISYFPAAFPVRAVIRDRVAVSHAPVWGGLDISVPDQLAKALGAEPWVQDIPVMLGLGRLGLGPDGAPHLSCENGATYPVLQSHVPAVAFGLALHSTAAIMRHGRLVLLASATDMGALFYDE